MRFLDLCLLVAAVVVAGCGAEAVARPEPTLTSLARGLEDPDRGVRYACVMALGKAGAEAVVLAPGLRDPVWCVRQEAGWWLRRRGASALPVIRSALGTEDPAVRASAAWALSGFDATAFPLLERALSDPAESVRLEALMAARRMGTRLGGARLEPLEPLLRDRFERGSVEERYEAALAIVWARPKNLGAVRALLVERLRAESQHSALVGEIVRALLASGDAGRKALDGFTGRAWGRLPAAVAGAQIALDQQRLPNRSRVPAPPTMRPARRLPPMSPPPDPVELADALRRTADPDVRQRIEAWLDLGDAHANADVFLPAMAAKERDERIAVATALGSAAGDAARILAPLLRDANWRVQCAAVRSWGRHGADPARVAPFLASQCLPLARAAYEAIRQAHTAPAAALVAAIESGHYGALRFSRLLFEHFGTAGAPATARLAALLSHDDVNVREAAARCLAAIGPPASAAVPALIEALGDERLCVIAHASLALGRIGAEDPVRATLEDKRARVRAYGAFALGWMLGARRGVDQVPFEQRLPVLDVGAHADTPATIDFAALGDELDPDEVALLRRGIWSQDPEVSIAAAARLDYDQVDARESERVMELLLPEGQRRGGPADLDLLRSIIGSSEVPAFVQYVTRAARTSPPRGSIFSPLHRVMRAEHLPWLCYLERVEELDAIDDNGDMWMPAGYTARAMRERLAVTYVGDPGPRVGDPARALMRSGLVSPEEEFGKSELWLINDLQPEAADADLLLRFARDRLARRKEGEEPYALWAALRALGRVQDDASESFLQELAEERSVTGHTAAAALLQRGSTLARALLTERGLQGGPVLLILADASPRAAARVLGASLAAEDRRDVAPGVFRYPEQYDFDFMIGARLRPEVLIGLEPALLASAPDATRLARAALRVPGCATRRVAAALFDELENDAARPLLGGEDEDEDEDALQRAWWASSAEEVLAFLHAADAERLTALLSYLVLSEDDDDTAWQDVALDCLFLLGDKRHVDRMLARYGDDGCVDADSAKRIDGPVLRAWLAARSQDEDLKPAVRADALDVLAVLEGWPLPTFDLDEFPEAKQAEVAEWVRQGLIDRVRAAYPEPEALTGDHRWRASQVWVQLGYRAVEGDTQARAAFWSACRAGRYRWTHNNFDETLHTLGRDWATYPQWISDLDSNCCRVSDGLADALFERGLGMGDLYGTEKAGFGRPLSERVWEWFDLQGGALGWSAILGRWIPTPE